MCTESDPVLKVFSLDGGKEVELFKTSVEMDDPNPQFLSKWRRGPFSFEERNDSLRISVYDADVGGILQLIGWVDTTYDQIVKKMQNKGSFELFNSAKHVGPLNRHGYLGAVSVYVDPVFKQHDLKVNISAEVNADSAQPKMFVRLLRGSQMSSFTPVWVSNAQKGKSIQLSSYSTTLTDFLLGDETRLFALELYQGSGWKPGHHTLLGMTQTSITKVRSAKTGSRSPWIKYDDRGAGEVFIDYVIASNGSEITLRFDFELDA